MVDMDLTGPEFFECERYRIRMLKIRCVQMQEKNIRFTPRYEIACRDCSQGRKIRTEVKKSALRR